MGRSCVKFSDKELEQSNLIDKVFKNAVAALVLEMPSLLTSIERSKKPDGASFVYRPLSDMTDLERRISVIAEVVKTPRPLDAGVKEITDDFYSETRKRISIELGSALVHLYFVSSTLPNESGKYALLLQSHHSLNDFLSAMSIFDGLLSNLATINKPDDRLLSKQVERLHPCYLDFLREPVDHFSASEEETAEGSRLINEVRTAIEKDVI